jgi:hypothetical protein
MKGLKRLCMTQATVALTSMIPCFSYSCGVRASANPIGKLVIYQSAVGYLFFLAIA